MNYVGDTFRFGGTLFSYIPGVGGPFEKLFDAAGQYFDPQSRISARPIKEFGVNSGEPFSPLDLPFGPSAPVDGVVAYIGPITKKKVSTTSGKGGGSQTVDSYQYFADVAIDFCEAPDGGIVEYTSLWADGQFVYGQNPDQNETSDELALEVVTLKGKTFVDISSPLGGPNLKKFKPSGDSVVMTGWATGGNNITADPVSSKKKKSDGTSILRLLVAPADAAGVADEAAGSTVTLFQANQKSNLNDLADVELYLGTDSQIASPAIEANEGTGNVEAARGRCRVVINKLYLNKWGNRVPMSWRAVVQAHASLTLAQAISGLLLRGGLTAGQFDVTGLTGDVQGFVLRAGDAPASMVVALMMAYDLMAREVSGQLVFFHREDAPHVTVGAEDLGAHAADESPRREIDLERSPALDLPSDVRVSFLDPTKDLQQSDARQQIANATTQASVSVNLPIVLDPEDARAIAKRLAWMPRATRHEATFNCPPSRQDIVEGDVLDVTAHGEAWHLVAQRVEAGKSGIVAVRAQSDNTGVVSVAPIAGSDDDSDSLQVPPPIALDVMDIPAITPEHVLLPGRYFALALYDTEQPWPGGVVYESTDDGDSFLPIALAQTEAIAGYVSAVAVSGSSGGGLVWDLRSSFTVTIWNGELESISEADALALHNLAALRTPGGEWELIIFRNATLIGTTNLGHKEYQVDTILRGVRGTEYLITTITAGSAFVLLEPSQFSQGFIADLGTERLYKAVPNGGASSDFSDTEELTVALHTLTPWAPTLISITPDVIFPLLDGSRDETFVWHRRTRAFTDPLEPDQVTLAEEVNEFYVDIYVSGGFVRTEMVPGGDDGETTWTYTAADQITDGANPTDIGTVIIYQRSTSVGRGSPLGPLG